MTRTEQVELYKANHAAWAKYHHNRGKLEFLSYTGRVASPTRERYSEQLGAMRTAAIAAGEAFADAVSGLHATEIASIIEEAGR